MIDPLIRSLYAQLKIRTGPATPDGVVARTVEGRTLYVNTTPGTLSVAMPGAKSGTARDVLTGRKLPGALDLAGYGVALVE
ncbi:hypothetical protein QP175_13490 [Sphingomonas aerolata]|uniref:hypothetical protein n=1 Tax=Sphingomonas aerolata TaxID=185951 RepID=UPI002FE1F21C